MILTRVTKCCSMSQHAIQCMAAVRRVEFCLGIGIRVADGWDGMEWDDFIFNRFISFGKVVMG